MFIALNISEKEILIAYTPAQRYMGRIQVNQQYFL